MALDALGASQLNNPMVMLGQAADYTDRIAAFIQAASGSTPPATSRAGTRSSRPVRIEAYTEAPANRRQPDQWERAATPSYAPSQNYALADAQALGETVLRAIGVDPPPSHDFGESTSQLINRQPWLQDPPRNGPEEVSRAIGTLLPAAAVDAPAGAGPAAQVLIRGGRVLLPALSGTGLRNLVKGMGGTSDQQDVADLAGTILGGGNSERLNAGFRGAWRADDLGSPAQPGRVQSGRQRTTPSEQNTNTSTPDNPPRSIAPPGDHAPPVVGGNDVLELDGGPVRVNPTIQYGGPHKQVTGIPGYDSHHLVSDSISPIARGNGLAIAMTRSDHRNTASYGSGAAAAQFRATQADLISAGRYDLAHQMGVDDIRAIHGSKYDEAIRQLDQYDLDGGKRQ
jgi:hypothetical protein